jgi:hypothetical protein
MQKLSLSWIVHVNQPIRNRNSKKLSHWQVDIFSSFLFLQNKKKSNTSRKSMCGVFSVVDIGLSEHTFTGSASFVY